jgi:hypothetical protein
MIRHPFSGSEADDRETPLVAIEDLNPALLAAAGAKGISQLDLHIYDPYYCRGAMNDHFISLGYNAERIHNDPVDCYNAQKNNSVPEFHVLVSNPPFSGDHIQRCLHYAVASKKPWALLLPSNVMLRPWFAKETQSQQIMFIAPHERYGFERHQSDLSSEALIATTATTESAKMSEKHIPFVTMWFLGGIDEDCLHKLRDTWASSPRKTGATFAESPDELPRKIRKLFPFAKVSLLLYQTSNIIKICNNYIILYRIELKENE